MKKGATLYDRVRQILESARSTVARSVNSTQVVANWLIGEEIVEEEQDGKWRAGYGKQVLQELSNRLQTEYGNGYSVDNLELFRRFYREYPVLIPDAVRRISQETGKDEKASQKSHAIPTASVTEIGYAVRSQSWKIGQMHPNLSWTHYRTLLRVDKPEARAFYEIEALKNNWGGLASWSGRYAACSTNVWR